MKQEGNSVKANKRRLSTQSAIKLSLPQGDQNAQTYMGPKSDWSNLWKKKKSLSTTAKYKDALLTQKYLKCNLQSSGVGMDVLGKGFSILALPLYPSISTIMVY